MDGSKENRNLELSSRNIRGVELVPGNQVHPYHLLRYETAIFSKPALEKLQDALKASSAQAQSGGGVMKSAYQIIRKPVITEKGLGVKENQGTLVFEVNAAATKTEVKEAVQKIFKVKVDSVRTANFRRQRTPPGQVCRLPSGLEEGIRKAEGGREDARVRGQYYRLLSRRG